MNDNFKKMKRKLMVEFYLKISLVSLSLWLTVSGLIILFTNLFGAKFPLYLSILIGAVIGICLFVVLLIKKKPNDTQIALRIDRDFNMHEKVATMVTFQNTDGFMYEKQREDAKENLQKKEVRKLPFRLAMVNIPALVCLRPVSLRLLLSRKRTKTRTRRMKSMTRPTRSSTISMKSSTIPMPTRL